MRTTAQQLSILKRALTLGAVLTLATTNIVSGQTADSTQRPPGAGMRGGMGQGRGMRPRFAPGPEGFGPGGEMGAPGMRAGRFGGGPRALMRGITLSVEQEKALRATHARHILEGKPLRIELLSASTDAQVARLNGDQKALDAATARATAARTKLDSLRGKGSPIEALRGVLTPDQQKILDKNLAEAPRDGRGFGPGRGPGMRNDGFGPGRGRSPNGMGPRGFRDGPPPRRPDGEETDDELLDLFDIPR